jgi:hypothetical protein
MDTVLEIYDERRAGAKRELRHRLGLPADRITAPDLIRCRTETGVAIHHAVERARFNGETAAYDANPDAPNEWPVTPGPGLNLKIPGSATLIESEPLIAVALETFTRNGFFMISDGRQIADLDEVLTIEHESALTFLRLVPLVGG